MASQDQIHSAVQERYARIARASDLRVSMASCCSDSAQGAADCGCSANLYDARLLEDLPESVTGLSLGCGDPVTIAGLQPGETVLDLGSGGGIDCFLAARQVGESGRVIGVDMTPEMLNKANANKARLGLTQVEFRQGHIEALPVEDVSIDVVMSNCVINLSPDKPAVFHEVFRVLRPGGRVSISDIVTQGEFSDDLRADLAQWSECVTGAVEARIYETMLAQAGFTDIQIVDKADAETIIGTRARMPRIFSARITARKPA